MDTMIVLWMLAGFAVGAIGTDLLSYAASNHPTPTNYRIIGGLVGTLAAFEIYTRFL